MNTYLTVRLSGDKAALPYVVLLVAMLYNGMAVSQDDIATHATGENDTTVLGPLPGHSYHGEAFDEGPRQKAYLMPGMPKLHFPVTTMSTEAQAFIDQGIGQLHGFWYYEAERSFRQAAMLDKGCTMAYWGMAMANINNVGRAKKFMDVCIAHNQEITEREKLYIEAATNYFNTSTNRKKRNEDHAKALERLLYRFPDDIEARALLVLQLWKNRDSSTPIQSYLAVDALLEQVFAVNTMHPAHHYRIHLWDIERADQALRSAALCGQSSPGIAHMWHMPGHIYSRLKRYDDACWQQEAAARVDHAHMMRDWVMPDQIHEFAHNNEWLIRNLILVGRMGDAIALAKNMCELPRHPKYNTLAKGSARFGRQRLLEALSRFELWDELISLCQTHYLESTDDETQELLRLRYLGAAHYRTGKYLQGDLQLVALETMLAQKKAVRDKAANESWQNVQDSNIDTNGNERALTAERPKGDQSTINIVRALNELRGHQAVAQMRFKDGLELLRKSGNADQDYLAWVQFKAGEKDKAIEAARKVVQSHKNEVIPLARLVELEWLAGDNEKTTKSLNDLREISGSIDTAAPFYARIAAIAKDVGIPENWKLTKRSRRDIGVRPPLDSLGPIHWGPASAPTWTLEDVHGLKHSLSDYHAKPVIILFFLGHGCLHCAQQVQAFGAAAKKFADLGVEIVAVSSDSAEGLKQSVESYKDGSIPFPLVSDDRLESFKAYRCFDDFEDQPMHGTFLLDREGLIRWQDISYQPFQETDFLLAEAKRLLACSAIDNTTCDNCR